MKTLDLKQEGHYKIPESMFRLEYMEGRAASFAPCAPLQLFSIWEQKKRLPFYST